MLYVSIGGRAMANEGRKVILGEWSLLDRCRPLFERSSAAIDDLHEIVGIVIGIPVATYYIATWYSVLWATVFVSIYAVGKSYAVYSSERSASVIDTGLYGLGHAAFPIAGVVYATGAHNLVDVVAFLGVGLIMTSTLVRRIIVTHRYGVRWRPVKATLARMKSSWMEAGEEPDDSIEAGSQAVVGGLFALVGLWGIFAGVGGLFFDFYGAPNGYFFFALLGALFFYVGSGFLYRSVRYLRSPPTITAQDIE